MGIERFELTQEHLNLLKHLKFTTDEFLIVSTDDVDVSKVTFGENSLYDGRDLILNATRHKSDNDFESITYSDEEIERFDKLFKELPKALEICIQFQSFKTGKFYKRFHDYEWKS
jgi:hypothetical protein